MFDFNARAEDDDDPLYDDRQLPGRGSEDPPTVLLPVVLHGAMRHGADTTDPMALVGREALLERLTNLLHETYGGRASYLLGGYRGTGKTNVVNRAIARYEKRLHGRREVHEMTPRRMLYCVRISKGNRKAARRNWFMRALWATSRLRYKLLYFSTGWFGEIKEFIKRKFAAKVKFFGPATLKIRVNLSKENMTARDVMFEITAMLRTRVQLLNERCVLWQTTLLFVSAVAWFVIAYTNPAWEMDYFLAWFFGLVDAFFVTGGLAQASFATLVSAVVILGVAVLFVRSSVRIQNIALVLLSFLVLVVAVSGLEGGIAATLSGTTQSAAAASALIWSNIENPGLVLTAVVLTALFLLSLFWFSNIAKLARELKRLNRQILATRHHETEVRVSGVSSRKMFSMEPLDEHKIEDALIRALDRNSRCWSKSIDPIFVIDELDKLGSHVSNDIGSPEGAARRLEAIEKILGNLKHLLTVAKARFIVIAGRDMLDRYQADRRLTSSLYETLFDQYFEVPSLLTDKLVSDLGGFATMTETYVSRRLIRECDAVSHWLELEWMLECYKEKKRSPDVMRKKIHGVCIDTQPSDAVVQLKKLAMKSYLVRANSQGDRHLAYLPYRLPVLRHYLIAEHNDFRRQAKKSENGNNKIDCAEIDNVILLLRHFIHYLTFYSAGNCKKLESLFDGSVRSIEGRPIRATDRYLCRPGERTCLYLRFSNRHQRRLVMGSFLYVMFYHHMSRQLRIGGDKLAVSTLVALHHILKFHSAPFSRHQLELIVSSDDIHRAPDIDHSIDTLISLSLRGILLKVNGGLYQFRFNYAFQQELVYISRTSDLEAATYNFSLSAMEATRIRLHRELERAYKLFGGVGVSDVAKGAIVIADLNIALGEIHVLEQDLHQAERCFATACDTLRRAFSQTTIELEILVQLVEAYLKLGLVHERRLRLDRAAAAYSAANDIVAQWVMIDDKNNKNNQALVQFFGCRPTKRDLLIQPWLALRYLQLKRNPAGAASRDRKPPNPLHIQRVKEPSYNCQLGELAMYAGDYDYAVRRYVRTMREMNLQSPLLDEESAAVGANASVSLAEALFVRHTQRLPNRIVDKLGSKPCSAQEYSNHVFAELVDFLEFPDDGEFSFADHADDIGRLTEYLRAMDNSSLIRRREAKFSHVIALCALAGAHLMNRGKYYRAGVAYLRGVTLWCMSFELVAVDLLTDTQKEALRKVWSDWRQTIAFLIKRAERNLSDSDDRAVMRFKETFLWRDAWPDETANGPQGPGVSLRRILIGADGQGNNRAKQIHWHDSLMSQQLVWTTIWGDLLGDLLLESRENPTLNYFDTMLQRDTPLCSTRALTFSHWLHGRLKLREVERGMAELEKLEKLKSDFENKSKKDTEKQRGPKADEAAAPVFDREQYESDKKRLEIVVSNFGAQSVQNLYSATKHLKILASNDQSLMFPPQAFVFFHLWKVLAILVEYVNKGEDTHSYIEAVVGVRQALIDAVKSDTPACYLDLRYVKDRALRYLRAAENMSDVSGRVRTEIIRGKQLLAGDYADPQFHLEWTLIQSMRPTAILLQKYIKERTKEIQGRKRYGPDSLWDYLFREPQDPNADEAAAD